MIAFSAGGRSAATCRLLKPLHEIPVIPTLPVHQGWREIHSITSTASACSWAEYSSPIAPSESPEPRMSTRIAA